MYDPQYPQGTMAQNMLRPSLKNLQLQVFLSQDIICFLLVTVNNYSGDFLNSVKCDKAEHPLILISSTFALYDNVYAHRIRRAHAEINWRMRSTNLHANYGRLQSCINIEQFVAKFV